MNRFRLPLIAIGILFACSTSRDRTNLAVEGDQSSKISVSEFNQDRVIGYLEHPLGKVVRVTGISVDGNTTRAKGDEGNTLLEVQRVNGKKLDRPYTFRDYRYQLADREGPPVPGGRFDYYAYEEGRFSGYVEPPKELGFERRPIANDGFYYHAEMVIIKNNAAPKAIKPK